MNIFLFGYIPEVKGPTAFFAHYPNAAFLFGPELIEPFDDQLMIDAHAGIANQHPVISNTTNTFKFINKQYINLIITHYWLYKRR